MEDDHVEVPSKWPEDIDEAGNKIDVEKTGAHDIMLEDLTFTKEPSIVDFNTLAELASSSGQGSSQLANLVKIWEYQQEDAVRLLREELEKLSQQRRQVELSEIEVCEQQHFEEESHGGDKRPVSVLDAEYNTVAYWKQQALHLRKLLEASVQREQLLSEKLEKNIKNLEKQTPPVEELSHLLKRADNFLHFVLQNAPVVIGHQDKELRYRFIYNHFPGIRDEDIIGKTDLEIFKGGGVKESLDFKREVLERGLPAKREITFETELFGAKTFLMYVEPVFNKYGEKIGVNYMGMEITDQVKKREKMAKLREEIAVQKAKEMELNKTIYMTEETMRAKQMLATMSHEIRSPLSGVVSMAEILSTTKLDKDQKQLLSVMLSSGGLVLQLINDILDPFKPESGVMRLEATKFRPREVIKNVLQAAKASLKKMLILEGNVADDVPMEVIGDVLWIRKILSNLISNAIKFTHEGKVQINLYVIADPHPECQLEPTINEDGSAKNGHQDKESHSHETVVCIHYDVTDTGIGIPDAALTDVFKKCKQTGADTGQQYGGTGSGLAICKQLVEQMGGQLIVLSKEHSGSTFTFILPHKVSHACDSSDKFDDMADESSDDDISCGF